LKKVDGNSPSTDADTAKMPRKIRQLIADLEEAGFVGVPGGKGSHRKFRHPKYAGAVVLSGHDGDERIITRKNKSAMPFARQADERKRPLFEIRSMERSR
jgi:predicted RNA binding protein YcfA (HicA-like mRNA interferase family)